MANVDFGGYKRIVQYFYDPEPKNTDKSSTPIWCLGQEYTLPSKTDGLVHPSEAWDIVKKESNESEPTQAATPPKSEAGSHSSIDTNLAYDESTLADTGGGWPAPFLDDFESRISFTYRSGFPAIAKSQDPKATSTMTFAVRLRNMADRGGFTSDTGFGCMIRSGQSLLANAILCSRLGRAWRRGGTSYEERRILSLFADDPKAPYSIHNFVQHGASACGKHPGEWFGPSATASCIQELSNSDHAAELRVYVTGDGSDVYEDSFMGVAKADGRTFKPTLILVGTRLGIDKVTPAYYDPLTALLRMPQSIGIAGGRPSAAHYFVAVQGPNLFYLDPHQTKPFLPLHDNADGYTEEEVNSCHTRRLRMVNVKEMDPSMLIGFLIRDEDDWRQWREAITSASGKTIVHVADKLPTSYAGGGEREGALDEVESFDEEEDDDNDTILNVQTEI